MVDFRSGRPLLERLPRADEAQELAVLEPARVGCVPGDDPPQLLDGTALRRRRGLAEARERAAGPPPGAAKG